MCHLYCRTGFVFYSHCVQPLVLRTDYSLGASDEIIALLERMAKGVLVGGELCLEFQNLNFCPDCTTGSFDNIGQNFPYLDT